MELIGALNETILGQVEEEDIEVETVDSSEFMDEIDTFFLQQSRTPRAWRLKILSPRRRKQIRLSKINKPMSQGMEVVAPQR